MNLSKLREIVKGREAWRATVHGVGHKDSDMTWQLNNNKERIHFIVQQKHNIMKQIHPPKK